MARKPDPTPHHKAWEVLFPKVKGGDLKFMVHSAYPPDMPVENFGKSSATSIHDLFAVNDVSYLWERDWEKLGQFIAIEEDQSPKHKTTTMDKIEDFDGHADDVHVHAARNIYVDKYLNDFDPVSDEDLGYLFKNIKLKKRKIEQFLDVPEFVIHFIRRGIGFDNDRESAALKVSEYLLGKEREIVHFDEIETIHDEWDILSKKLDDEFFEGIDRKDRDYLLYQDMVNAIEQAAFDKTVKVKERIDKGELGRVWGIMRTIAGSEYGDLYVDLVNSLDPVVFSKIIQDNIHSNISALSNNYKVLLDSIDDDYRKMQFYNSERVKKKHGEGFEIKETAITPSKMLRKLSGTVENFVKEYKKEYLPKYYDGYQEE